jgi:predicted AlkP superfamily phosphohydrolase/phosphomutase
VCNRPPVIPVGRTRVAGLPGAPRGEDVRRVTITCVQRSGVADLRLHGGRVRAWAIRPRTWTADGGDRMKRAAAPAGLKACPTQLACALRLALVGLVVALSLVPSVACGRRHTTLGRRIVVLGFDGLDYGLTRDLMARGRLPNFSRLAASGSFAPLGTSIPPQSPVAWSGFITGLDPGEHGIFDFVHRDPKTLTPYLSTTRTESGGHAIPIGRWQLPLTAGRVELLRRGRPFWDVLERHGITTTIIRMPANFPPSGRATRELSGMGTPDLLGTYGTFSYFTSGPLAMEGGPVAGGVIYPVDVEDGTVHASLEGPRNPFVRDLEYVKAPFTAHIDATRRYAKLVVGAEERLLRVGEWSDWVPVEFSLMPTQRLHAECRFYLKALDPDFELYVSPLNLDPLAPAMPLSTPDGYAGDLARATGRFYTQGMPEDTNSLKTGVLTPAEFLAQARIAGDENVRQYRYVLDRFADGFLFYYFGLADQVSHMMWRPMDPQHPAYNAAVDAPFASVIADLYAGFDAIVGETTTRLGPTDLLVVMSDHGFASWRRALNLNTWLRDNGYLAVRDPRARSAPEGLANIDWHKTRAYGLGINGLYVNLKGREAFGIVDPADRAALVSEIAGKLLATTDPSTGAPAVTKVYRREEVYRLDGLESVAPDAIVGYAKGTRASDESALGSVSGEVLTDNTTAWSGDHCMDAAAVPGILLTSRPLGRAAATLQDLPASLLGELGIAGFPTEN